MWTFWLIVSGIFLIFEIFTAGFLFFWLGVAGILSMITSIFISNVAIQTAVFVLVSAILILFTRPLVNKLLKVDKKEVIPTNVYRLINKEGIVVEDFDKLSHTGKVKVSGELWSAIADTDLQKDTRIKVLSVDGVKLKVEKVFEKSTIS